MKKCIIIVALFLFGFLTDVTNAANPATDYFVLQCAKRHIEKEYGDCKIQVNTPAYETDEVDGAEWVIKIGFLAQNGESYDGRFYIGLPKWKRQPKDMCVIKSEFNKH